MSLKSKEQKIYELLKVKAKSQDKDGHFCIYPRKQLATDCGVNEKTVQRTLNELEKRGYIIRKRQDDHQTQKIYLLNVPCSTLSDENVPCSTLSDENVPCSTSVDENVPCSTLSGENVRHSIVDTEKMSPSTQSVAENDTPSTECTAITKSQKKPFLPHLELSAITAERMFYTMPTSPASHFLFDILAAAEDIANIPKRKKHVNHGTKYEVKASGNKRQVSMENYQGTAKVTVELADINILNKAGKKLLILSMIKANEQSLHNGELTRDYISFPLQELVDYGLYSRLSGARKGFAIGTDALTSIKIKGTIRKTKKSTATIQALEVPFTGAKIENNQCFIYLNNRIDWKFLAQYFTKIPKYYFKLSNRASDLLYYIFYLARQHTNEIAERGYFTVRFWAIHSLLQLPDPSTARNPQRDIKEVIENAITEIETEHNTTYGNKELSFALVYSEQAGISEYLDNGYLKVSLSGAFAEFFIEQSHTRESKIDREEKKQARIEEKAKAINIARSMENGKPNHTQDGNN